ncbi:MAG: HAMP domain-containing sensor histidine kinase [Meiothermus sp.]|nr:HAMP domain-containing sensor histidine kinase [Meiothermus sp.]
MGFSLWPLGLLSAALVGAVFVGDVLTPQALVFAILYNVPIALTALAFSRRLTVGMTLLALLANVAAGVTNAQQGGEPDMTAALNRALAALSFFLVAFLSLQAAQSTLRLSEVQAEERRTRRERQLRQLVEDLSGPLTPQELLEKTARLLKNFLEADTVAVMGLSGGRWGERVYAAPKDWQAPAEVPTASQKAVRETLLDARVYLLGQLRPNLVLLLQHPRLEESQRLLSELIPALQALLGKAEIFANLQNKQSEIVRRNGVIRDLVYAFSHDLRTPLMANAMSMRLALEGAYGELSEEYRRTLRNGLEANQDLLELADQLLLVARLESGEAQPPKVPLDLAQLAASAVERLRPLFDGRGIEVRLHAPARLELSGREGELHRLLQNLLDNAAKFAPPDSLVEVRVGQRQSMAVLEVVDGGQTIPPEARERLFTRFSSQRAGGGKGLGLYLARRIAEGHGGTIGYIERSGGGGMFRVELPLGVAEAVSRAP